MAMSSFRRVRGLLASWVTYWVVLALVKLGPAARAIWHATHAPPGEGNVAVNFGDGVLSLTVTEHAQSTYAGSIHLLALALWVAGPPLLLWLVWMVRRPRPEMVGRERSLSGRPGSTTL